jgi:hypothetical protein
VAPQAAPVGLGLLAGRGLEAHHRLAAALPVGVGKLFEDRKTTGVAEGADLVCQGHRRELGVVGQARQQVVLVGVELAGQRASGTDRRTVAAQGGPDGVAADPKPDADRPDRQPLAAFRAVFESHAGKLVSETLGNGTVHYEGFLVSRRDGWRAGWRIEMYGGVAMADQRRPGAISTSVWVLVGDAGEFVA